MEFKMSVKTNWYDVDYPCPMEGCNGTFKAKLPDFDAGKTVRCSQGHTVTLRDANGNIGSVLKSVKKLGH